MREVVIAPKKRNVIERTAKAVTLNGKVICRPCGDNKSDKVKYRCNRNSDHRGKHRNGKKEWKS